MKELATVHDLYDALKEIIDIPKECSKVVITLEVNSLPTIETEKNVYVESEREMVKITKRFNLVAEDV